MAELKEYEVVVNGMTTTLRLSDADAKKRGLKAAAPAKHAPAKAAAKSAGK